MQQLPLQSEGGKLCVQCLVKFIVQVENSIAEVQLVHQFGDL